MLLETWEQHLFENPDSMESRGINKCVNNVTGYKYYKTGDEIIDKLEEAFARGEDPDLNAAFAHIGEGVSIFRSDLWSDPNGGVVIPDMTAPKVVTWSDKGEKMSEAGNKVEIADFSSDDWLKQGLEDDPILKGLAKKLGVANG